MQEVSMEDTILGEDPQDGFGLRVVGVAQRNNSSGRDVFITVQVTRSDDSDEGKYQSEVANLDEPGLDNLIAALESIRKGIGLVR